jgi:tRNA threonylcarbamoyl adenosine modification protein (Sua5/YciO/YrdC/YwlC family)
MKLLKIKKFNATVLRSIAAQIKKGAIVVYPTDTAYAIGCDATNARAVHKIFAIKGRPKVKAMPIIVADLKMAIKFFKLTTRNSQLATKYWPGPLSIVVKAKKGIVASALSKGTAAIRVPDSNIARRLSKLTGRPLIATSANLSGEPLCYSVKAFLRQLATRSPSPKNGRGVGLAPHRRDTSGAGVRDVDIVLDCAALPRRKPSTIIKINKDGLINIVRKGPVGLDIRY